ASPAHAWNGRVLRVLTGDTLVVSRKEQTRTITLYGIKCPDPQTIPGKKAKKFATASITGKSIKINPITRSSQGRIVAMVFRSGQNFNEFLLRSGYAIVNRKQCHAAACRKWLQYEKNVYKHHRGIWADIEQQSSRRKKWNHQ
ncbi:MAG TPA: hypothetical protein ENJ30_10275, partial [Desulfobulbaceae bacterium]|nr:hypothetical protein [Desulfobulbaceae bacterium]